MKFLYEMRIVASNHFAFMDLVKKKIFFQSLENSKVDLGSTNLIPRLSESRSFGCPVSILLSLQPLSLVCLGS